MSLSTVQQVQKDVVPMVCAPGAASKWPTTLTRLGTLKSEAMDGNHDEMVG
jgi:hypothetical protein